MYIYISVRLLRGGSDFQGRVVCLMGLVSMLVGTCFISHMSWSCLGSPPKRLKAPCGGMSTQGKAMIARIQRGELPPGLKSWPSEKVGCAPNLIEL